MNLQIGILSGAIAFSVLSFVFSMICFAKNKKSADLIEDSKNRSTDQARRIAWLEARIRKPEKIKKDILSQEVLITPKPSETNITERRHRVLTLAARGQDAETIASTLGMLTGEVELIMRIGRGSVNFA